jgi:hypothetical protein
MSQPQGKGLGSADLGAAHALTGGLNAAGIVLTDSDPQRSVCSAQYGHPVQAVQSLQPDQHRQIGRRARAFSQIHTLQLTDST